MACRGNGHDGDGETEIEVSGHRCLEIILTIRQACKTRLVICMNVDMKRTREKEQSRETDNAYL